MGMEQLEPFKWDVVERQPSAIVRMLVEWLEAHQHYDFNNANFSVRRHFGLIAIFACLIAGALLVASVVFNLMLVSNILRLRALRSSRIFLVQLNVSACDVLRTCALMPLTLVSIVSKDWVLGAELCHILPMMQQMLPNICNINFLVLAYEHYRGVQHAVNGVGQGWRRAPIAVFVLTTWMLGFVSMLPFGQFSQFIDLADVLSEKLHGVGLCVVAQNARSFEIFRLIAIIGFVVPFIVSLYLYFRALAEESRMQLFEDNKKGRQQHNDETTLPTSIDDDDDGEDNTYAATEHQQQKRHVKKKPKEPTSSTSLEDLKSKLQNHKTGGGGGALLLHVPSKLKPPVIITATTVDQIQRNKSIHQNNFLSSSTPNSELVARHRSKSVAADNDATTDQEQQQSKNAAPVDNSTTRLLSAANNNETSRSVSHYAVDEQHSSSSCRHISPSSSSAIIVQSARSPDVARRKHNRSSSLAIANCGMKEGAAHSSRASRRSSRLSAHSRSPRLTLPDATNGPPNHRHLKAHRNSSLYVPNKKSVDAAASAALLKQRRLTTTSATSASSSSPHRHLPANNNNNYGTCNEAGQLRLLRRDCKRIAATPGADDDDEEATTATIDDAGDSVSQQGNSPAALPITTTLRPYMRITLVHGFAQIPLNILVMVTALIGHHRLADDTSGVGGGVTATMTSTPSTLHYTMMTTQRQHNGASSSLDGGPAEQPSSVSVTEVMFLGLFILTMCSAVVGPLVVLRTIVQHCKSHAGGLSTSPLVCYAGKMFWFVKPTKPVQSV